MSLYAVNGSNFRVWQTESKLNRINTLWFDFAFPFMPKYLPATYSSFLAFPDRVNGPRGQGPGGSL